MCLNDFLSKNLFRIEQQAFPVRHDGCHCVPKIAAASKLCDCHVVENLLHEIIPQPELPRCKYYIGPSRASVLLLDSKAKSLPCHLAAGRNEPLKKDRPKWKSDYPMTEGQLRSKRDEFWDTAPAFEGRKEIWDALKAAAVALECNDHELAQAIVDGASITLPHGEGHNE